MNSQLLKSRIVLENKSIEELAEEMGVSKSAIYKKLRGATEFTRGEVQMLIEILKLSDQDVISIFFD